VGLDGTLSLTLESGFNASLGTVFDIINWSGTETGDFSAFNNATFDDGTLTFEEVFNGNQLDLEVVATPEPSTCAMLFCAALLGAGIAWRTRRRRVRVAV
jgi:hypothetical protein